MIRHWAFFKQSDTSFGTFYPRHYIVAGYPNFDAAQAAENAFTASGTSGNDVRAATGDFVVNRLEAHREANRMERTEASVAGFAGTETDYLQTDAELAHRGGAFLFFYAPDDEHVQHARTIFATHRPTFARRYLKVAIERLIEPVTNPGA